MKTIIFSIIFFLVLVINSNAQKVYSVKYDYQADVKVFVTDYEYQADLLVYKVKYDYQAKDNKALWYFTDHDYQS